MAELSSKIQIRNDLCRRGSILCELESDADLKGWVHSLDHDSSILGKRIFSLGWSFDTLALYGEIYNNPKKTG